jgi:CheY-like chemotaxis protein
MRKSAVIAGGIYTQNPAAHLKKTVPRYFQRISSSKGDSRERVRPAHGVWRHREEGNRIRLELLDLGMPGMGGWECLKRLRTLDPSLPIVITTGHVGENLRKRAQQEGAAGLIAKPYRMESLILSVRQTLVACRI